MYLVEARFYFFRFSITKRRRQVGYSFAISDEQKLKKKTPNYSQLSRPDKSLMPNLAITARFWFTILSRIRRRRPYSFFFFSTIVSLNNYCYKKTRWRENARPAATGRSVSRALTEPVLRARDLIEGKKKKKRIKSCSIQQRSETSNWLRINKKKIINIFIIYPANPAKPNNGRPS